MKLTAFIFAILFALSANAAQALAQSGHDSASAKHHIQEPKQDPREHADKASRHEQPALLQTDTHRSEGQSGMLADSSPAAPSQANMKVWWPF